MLLQTSHGWGMVWNVKTVRCKMYGLGNSVETAVIVSLLKVCLRRPSSLWNLRSCPLTNLSIHCWPDSRDVCTGTLLRFRTDYAPSYADLFGLPIFFLSWSTSRRWLLSLYFLIAIFVTVAWYDLTWVPRILVSLYCDPCTIPSTTSTTFPGRSPSTPV